MNSPLGRSYPKRGQRTAPSYTGRRQRRSAGAPARGPVVDQSGAAAQKWTKVWRNPISPLDEPYFGSSPSASFKVPVWVKVSELSEEEKLSYDEAEKKKEEERSAWKDAMEERRAELDTEDDENEITKSNEEANRKADETSSQETAVGEGRSTKNMEGPQTQSAGVTSEGKPIEVEESHQEEPADSFTTSTAGMMKKSMTAAPDIPLEEPKKGDSNASGPVVPETMIQATELQDNNEDEAINKDDELPEPLRKKQRLDLDDRKPAE